MATKQKPPSDGAKRKKTSAKQVQKHLPSLREGFRKVLQGHGFDNLHVTEFALGTKAGDPDDNCVDEDGHIHCGPA
jgi:hypothetical protein